eukprot:jgi/Bigna1/81151/fgenesh1_pg.77_\
MLMLMQPFYPHTGSATELAGMGAANQVFSTISWAVSFLPSVTTPLVAMALARGQKEVAETRIAESLFVAMIVGTLGLSFLQVNPLLALSLVARTDAPFLEPAQEYLLLRSFSFIPALLTTVLYSLDSTPRHSNVAFSAFRGKMDTTTPLLISVFANLLNCILDPILMFTFNMGLRGAALATVIAEFASAFVFMTLMIRQKMVRLSKIFRVPEWASLKPLVAGGAAIQMRSLMMNLALLSATRTANGMDSNGVSAAAYQLTVIFWQLGATVMLALSTTASVMVSSQLGKGGSSSSSSSSSGGEEKEGEKKKSTNAGDSKLAAYNVSAAARDTADRMLGWGLTSGLIFGIAQLLSMPLIGKFSSIEAVNEAARSAAALVALSQFLNGLTFTGEGIMQGLSCFRGLAIISMLGAVAVLLGLKIVSIFNLGLTGVWSILLLFGVVRVAGVLLHRYKIGPLAEANSSLKSSTSST